MNIRSRVRTNYFRVTDAEKLTAILARCKPDDVDNIQLFNRKEDGETLYAFGCSSTINGYYVSEDEEADYDSLIDDLQAVVAPGDAIIIMEVGYEALKYVFGSAFIITSEDMRSVDFTNTVLKEAAEVLGNPDYQTTIEY